jgi:ABC-type dipeptide/oligopeptide/nickel transport system permease subunit
MVESHQIPDRSPAVRAWLRLIRGRSTWVGGALVGLFVLLALSARVAAPYGVNETSGTAAARPSLAHWLGTDALRKDVLTRVIYGARLSLLAGVVSITLAVALGAPLGAVAGYFGGRTDSLVMRVIDVALVFPSVLIALLVAAAWRPGWMTVVVAVGLINVPVFARQVRASVLSAAQLEYVLASRAFGASSWRILTREILPAILSPIVVLSSLSLGTAILEVAGLSFLGIGGDLTEPEWGGMLAQAKDYWTTNPWFALGPGAAISLTVLGFNLLGDGLRDALDPRVEASLL